MALNMDAVLKIVAKVWGVNEFKQVTDSIKGVGAATSESTAGLDRLSRSTREIGKTLQPTEQTLLKVRRELIELGNAGVKNERALKQQVESFKNLRSWAEIGGKTYTKLTADVRGLENQLKSLSATQDRVKQRGAGREALGGALGALATGGGLQSAAGSLAGSLAFSGGAGGLAAAAGVSAIAGAGALAARTGIDAESARVRLKALTDQFGEFNAAQASAATIARTLRISQVEAQDAFSKLYAALRPTGVTVKEVEDAFIGFAAAARASGATATETSAAMLQLKQALGSGVLQGDELRSIREQAPAVGQAIAKEMGVTVGELKKLGSEGKITTDIVLRALARLRGEKLGELNQQFNTAQQATTDFRLAIDRLGVRISNVFGPAALAALRAFTGLLERTADLLGGDFQDKQALMFQARAQASQQTRARFGPFGELGNQGFFENRVQQNYQRLLAERDARLARERGTDRPNASQQAAQDTAARERAQAAARAQQEATKKQQEEQQKIFEDELKIRADAEKRLADAAQQREEQIAAFRQETIRRAADLERQLGDQRRDIEREIAASRLATTRAQQDLDLELRLQAGGSTYDKAAIEQAKVLRDITRQFEDQILQGRQTAFDRQLTLQRQMEQFKVDTAQGIGRIEEAYARSVSAILQDAGDKLSQKMQEGAQLAAQTLAGASASATGGGGSATIASIADGSLNANARAWLAAIRAAEGTAGPNGYRTMFGGGLFSDMSRHPDRVIRSGGYASAAAGAYQFMPDTWRSVGGGAMTPERQDRAALALALRRGVDLSRAPFTRENVARLAPEWASLPTLRGGSYYGQPSWSFGALSNVFTRASGMPAPPVLPPAAPRVAPITGANLGSQAVAQANQQVQLRARELERQQQQAQAESRRAAFTGVVSNIAQSLTAAQAELTGRADSARQGLEDAVRYEQLLKEGITPELAQQRVELERIALAELGKLETTQKDLDGMIKSGEYTAKETKALQAQLDVVNTRIAAIPVIIGGIETEIEATKRLQKAREEAEGRDVGKGVRDGVKGYLEEIGTLAEGIEQVTGNALSGLEDQLVEFVTTGKASFNDFAASVLKDMSRIIIQQMVLAPILRGLFPPAVGGGVGALFGMPMLTGVPGITANAVGNVYGPSGLVPFANGGIVNSPTLFQFAGGTGLMGEAGPEAIVPLRRGKDGKLGIVSTGGGGSTSVVVNVNMQTGEADTRASNGDGQLLGKALSEAVQAELVRQKRPGGLLYR